MSGPNAENVSEVVEGRAKVILPQGVFYNPVQEFNRDLTVSVLCAFQRLHEKAWYEKAKKHELKGNKNDSSNGSSEAYPGIRILEALAASGLRSTRFALEVPKVSEIIANDIDPAAADLILKNAEANGHDSQRLIKSACKDANLLMMEHRTRNELFDVIDLDPYGSAAKFIPSAMMSIADGGLLCITCTDSAVLCGSSAGTSFGRYGGMSLRCSASQEMALRLLLLSLQHHAAVEGRYIVPLISLVAEFYVRVFVCVFRGPGKAKLAPCRSSMVYVCAGCGAQHLQPLARMEERPGNNVVVIPARGPPVGTSCEQCNSAFKIAGPMWSDNIHDVNFVEQMIKELKRTSDAPVSNSNDNSSSKIETSEDTTERNSETDFPGAFSKASLKTKDRMIGVLSLMAEELSDCPLFYRVDHMARVLHCHTPNFTAFRSAILNAGYQVSSTHINPMAYKTNASPSVLWDILRCWAKKHRPVSEQHLSDPTSLTSVILGKEPQIEVSFDDHELANPASRKEGLLRYQPNPEKYWGPKARAKRARPGSPEESLEEKSLRLQGKRSAQKAAKDVTCE